MTEILGTTGLVLNEPLLWEKGKPGRRGFSFPPRDVQASPLEESLTSRDLEFPDLSEVDVVRHFTRLSTWNFGVDTGTYPLGSCTMKYNPKMNDKQAALPGFAGAHPLLPHELSQGLLRLMIELERFLAEITGMDAVTLQPSAGAQGELTGMLLIHAFHKNKGRKPSKILVPDTAHGTNPSSAALCGYRPIPVESNSNGILSVERVAERMDEDTAGIMITNPNTLGLFEENIGEIVDLVHAKGGLVYGDGANMNAVLGMMDAGCTGLDVLHLNLHKTFSTPHGGGGPGAGPVCVKEHLAPFLPVPRLMEQNGRYFLSDNFPQTIGRLHAFYGNVGVMIRAYSYIRTMGSANLKKASHLAVLNANYVKERLKKTFHLPFDRPCMHECVFTDRHQASCKVTTLDIGKRLMDYGFHPPTIYFPLVVSGAMMIEPTETESKQDLDLLIEALEAVAGEAKKSPDLLRRAPTKPKVGRVDEAGAARKPCLAG
jgi:glycine dehydrogenase subunit 2